MSPVHLERATGVDHHNSGSLGLAPGSAAPVARTYVSGHYLVISHRKVLSSLYWEEEVCSSMCNSLTNSGQPTKSQPTKSLPILGNQPSLNQPTKSRMTSVTISITSEVLIVVSFLDKWGL